MKILKLIITFAIILGGVAVALFWDEIINIITPPPPPNPMYEELKNDIISEWNSENDWNKDLFLNNVSLIKQSEDELNGSAQTLQDLNRQEAINIVHKKIISQWQLPNCNHDVITNYNNAINVFGSDVVNKSATNNDPKVIGIRKVKRVYDDAFALSSKSLGTSPGFNGSSWNSYTAYCNKIKADRNAILSNPTYNTYLKNITSIKNGLNSIDSKLASGRTTFYKTLAGQIKTYFNSKERNLENLSKLTTVLDKYNSECGDGALTSFSVDFENQCYQ